MIATKNQNFENNKVSTVSNGLDAEKSLFSSNDNENSLAEYFDIEELMITKKNLQNFVDLKKELEEKYYVFPKGFFLLLTFNKIHFKKFLRYSLLCLGRD